MHHHVERTSPDDTIKFKITATPDPMAYSVADRDMLVIDGDGRIGIIRAGSRLPVYDLNVEEVDSPKSDQK